MLISKFIHKFTNKLTVDFIRHPITKIPKELKKHIIYRIISVFITSIVFSGFNFLIQGGKQAISSGHIVLGLILIALYYAKGTIDSIVHYWSETMKINFDEMISTISNNNTISVLLKVRNKVWSRNEQTNSMEIMSASTILNCTHNYLRELWDFWTELPLDASDIITFLVSFIGFILVCNIEIEHVSLFILILILISICSLYFSSKRRTVQNEMWKTTRKTNDLRDMLKNDILNIDPINDEHANYMIGNYTSANKSSFDATKKNTKQLNKLNFFEAIFSFIATLFIIGIKIFEVGLPNVNLDVVLSIMSIMTIYNSIMNSIWRVIRNIEGTMSQIDKIKIYQPDFQNILNIFDEVNENSKGNEVHINEVDVSSFSVQYQVIKNELPFTLKNFDYLIFKPNDVVLFVGPTGSGKSTFMKMITNNIKFDSFSPTFKTTSEGRIATIMHQTDGHLGCNYVLPELTLGKEVDEKKLLHILKGLHLYEEIFEKNHDVISYLSTIKIEQFSTGQKQRLTIARLLYNLTEDVQIIAFDEATNALNDAITLQTLNFVKEYCKDKILLVATHQVELGSTIATQTLEFVPSGTYYRIKPQKP